MSDLTTQIANAEMLLAFLKSQLPKEEVVEKSKKKVKKAAKNEEKPEADPAEKKEEEKPKKADLKKDLDEKSKKEKNLNRFTATMKTELTKVLKAHDVELTEELRKEFIDHLNSLEADEYTKVNLTAHMETFAKSNGKPEEEKDEEQPAKVGGSPFAGQDDPPDLNKLSNAHGYDLSKLQKSWSSEQIAEFKKTEILKPLGDGNYWHTKSGMWYFEDGDEDLDEISFDGKTYMVNKISKRVYETINDKDLFVGFLGIGPFKNMKV